MAYTVEVYENGIVRLIQVGDGVRWIRSKAKAVENRARTIVPKRTGKLMASHRTTQNRSGLGRYESGFAVSADASYARFVHEGTGIHGPRHAPIVKLKGMRIRDGRNPNPNRRVGSQGTFIHRSQGQRANPWLERAAAQVL